MDKAQLLEHFKNVFEDIDERLLKKDVNTALKYVHESKLLIKSELEPEKENS
jgi:hypothetical protein